MGHFAVVKIASDEADERFCVLEATLAAGGGFTSRLHRHHKYVESGRCRRNARVLLRQRDDSCAGRVVRARSALCPPYVRERRARRTGSRLPTCRAGWIVSWPNSRNSGAWTRASRRLPPSSTATTRSRGPESPGGHPVRVTTPGVGERLSVGGGTITILADSAATGGSFALVDYTAPPGFPGPPPHRHREIVDVFYVLEGELTMEIEGTRSQRNPGAGVGRAGTVHNSRTRRTGPRAFPDSSLRAASSSTSGTLRRRSATGRSIPRSPRR